MNSLLILAMYFTYCQLWIPVVGWAAYDDFVIRRPVKWAKTKRFQALEPQLSPGTPMPKPQSREEARIPKTRIAASAGAVEVTLYKCAFYLVWLALNVLLHAGVSAQAAPRPVAPDAPKTGFVLHFDAISNASEGRQLVQIAVDAGARVISVVPPARIWKNRKAVEMLDAILDEIARHKLSLIFARLDASYPPDAQGERFNYLYGRILTERGVLPNGARASTYFLTTVGRDDYNRWMEEEIRFYAQRYGKLSNLLGITVGPFSEPFTAQRCGFLEYTDETGRYEITQYTRYATRLWHRWLAANVGQIAAVNREYAVSFTSLDKLPLPRNETDDRFGKPQLAYVDFVRSLNDWFVERYERCRRIWHEVSGRADVPLILQFNGFELEKVVTGRPSYAAFDLLGWIARADAVGLSVYTNSGYDDFGHSSVKAMVDFLASAKDMGKELFVLESGFEAPNVVLDPQELEFFGTVALPLHPRTYIYEWLKDEFNEEYPFNPGKVVTRAGQLRPAAFTSLRDLFRRIETTTVDIKAPAIYARFDPIAVRENLHAGEVTAALYDIAADVPIHWIRQGMTVALRPGVPVVSQDGSVSPGNEKLSRLLESIPRADTKEREGWRERVVSLFRGSAAP